MVHCGVHHFEIARYVVIAKFGNVAQRLLAIIVLVALDVAFIFEIDTILVSKIIPVGVVAIVTIAHVVDVTTLHQHHFLLHLLMSDGMTTLGICFVAVHTLHLDGLAIEIIVATCLAKFVILSSSILNFNLTEADNGREGFEHLIFRIEQLTHKDIAPRRFCTPLLHECTSLEFHSSSGFTTLAHFDRSSYDIHTCYGSGIFAIELLFKEAITYTQAFEILLGEIAQRGFDV